MATIFFNPESADLTVQSKENSLKISVDIGYGMADGFLIYADNDLISLGKDATIDKIKKYENKFITVISTIKDKITYTNMTSVTVRFKENELETKSFKFEQELSQHLDTIIYVLKFKIALKS